MSKTDFATSSANFGLLTHLLWAHMASLQRMEPLVLAFVKSGAWVDSSHFWSDLMLAFH